MTNESTTITLGNMLSRRRDLLTSELSDDEMVLLNVERGAYFGMEGVAKCIWNELVEPRSVAELCEVLLTRFTVDRETCQREVLAFLTALHQQDLIVVSTVGMTGSAV